MCKGPPHPSSPQKRQASTLLAQTRVGHTAYVNLDFSPGVCLDAYRLMIIKSQRPYILHSIMQISYKTTVPFLLVHSECWLNFA